MRVHVRGRVFFVVDHRDISGDVYVRIEDNGAWLYQDWLSTASIKKLIRALEWAIAPTPKRRKKG